MQLCCYKLLQTFRDIPFKSILDVEFEKTFISKQPEVQKKEFFSKFFSFVVFAKLF
jgi:hypothetical protein